MANSKIQVLSDRFDQKSINTALWSRGRDVDGLVTYNQAILGQATVTVQSLETIGPGVSVATPSELALPVVSCLQSGLGSVLSYDLSNSGISAQLVSYPSDSASPYPQTYFALVNGSSSPNNTDLAWTIWNPGDGAVIAPTYGNPDLTYPPGFSSPVPYDENAHRFLRIVEHSGTVYWDYSADGSTWTNLGSVSTPFDVTSLFVTIYAVNGNTVPVQWSNVGYSLASS